jgi:hypothetical protein
MVRRLGGTKSAVILRVLLVGSLSLVMVIISSIDVDGDLTTTNLPVVVATDSSELGCNEHRCIASPIVPATASKSRRRLARALHLPTRSRLLTLSILPIRGP